MGKLIWSQWGRLMALTAGVFEIIGGVFGIFYRLSTFEQFTKIFNPFILEFNYLAISCIMNGLTVLMLEYPLPLVKNTLPAKSYLFKIFLYFTIGILSTINYQNVNPGFYLMLASLMYAKALDNDEDKYEQPILKECQL